MLNKKHNSVITLAILLSIVGISKPSTASPLAQSPSANTSFTIPDQLPDNSQVQIAASNSTTSINQSLKESFEKKYPSAKINIEPQDPTKALNILSEGKADLVAIGRSLTPEEKAQGFVSVPISREKIAIVVAKDNTFKGNLTIDQFAQIFKGEVTDWSELGGSPGKIQLVDLPESNDTRQAFPNYPIFQTGEFTTGPNAVKLDNDSIEEMIGKLGNNSVGYGVANDIVNRDDVRAISMHQTQPDDPRYPFSQPFSLIYKGTPSAAAQAFLGFATTAPGQQIIADRIGSASMVIPGATFPNLDGEASKGTSSVTTKPQTDGTTTGTTGQVNPDGTTGATSQVSPDGTTGATSQVNPDGTTGATGQVSPDGTTGATGQVSPDGTTEKQGKWYWWLPLLLLPLGALFLFGRRDKTDEEPAIDNVPDINGPSGKASVPPRSTGDNLSSLDLNVSDGSTKTYSNTTGANSQIGGAALATGAVVAGGAATAANFVGDKAKTEEDVDVDFDQISLNEEPNNLVEIVDQTNTDINEPIIEIPSNPVNEFTDQETRLQTTDQETGLQTTDQETRLQTDITEDINDTGSSFPDNVSQASNEAVLGGAALAGGAAAAASGFFSNREQQTDEEIKEVTEIPPDTFDDVTYIQDSNDSGQVTTLQTTEVSSQNVSNTATEFESDTVQSEGTISETQDNLEVVDELDNDFILEDDYSSTELPLESGDRISADLPESIEAQTNEFQDNIPAATADYTASVEDNYADLSENTVDTESSLIDQASQTDGAVWAAASSGFFSGTEQPTQIQGIDQEPPDFVDGSDSAIEESSTSFTDNVIADVETFDGDISFNDRDSTVEDENTVDTESSLIDQASQTDGAVWAEASSGFFRGTEQPTQIQGIDQEPPDFVDGSDSAIEESSTSFTDNVIADVESFTSNSDASLEDITFDDYDNSDASLDDITFDDSSDDSVANLDDITFDDYDNSDASLDDITFDDYDNSDASLDDITFDDSSDNSDANLDDITFDDYDNSDASLDDITFDDSSDDSIGELMNSIDITNNNSDINLDEIDFDESTRNTEADLSDETSNDINSISKWLDNLETNQNSDKSSDNISEWLNNLNANNTDSNIIDSGNKNAVESKEGAEDISFQFLEDLLERDSNANRDDK